MFLRIYTMQLLVNINGFWHSKLWLVRPCNAIASFVRVKITSCSGSRYFTSPTIIAIPGICCDNVMAVYQAFSTVAKHFGSLLMSLKHMSVGTANRRRGLGILAFAAFRGYLTSKDCSCIFVVVFVVWQECEGQFSNSKFLKMCHFYYGFSTTHLFCTCSMLLMYWQIFSKWGEKIWVLSLMWFSDLISMGFA